MTPNVTTNLASEKEILPTVIVGAGFVGLFTALHLRHRHYPHPIILIDPQLQFVFKPLLYEYLSGEMQAEAVLPSYEELLQGSEITFVQGQVMQVDLQGRRVVLESGLHYDYQYLVLAVGSIQGFLGTEGAEQFAFPLRTQADATGLKQHLRDCLQQASQCADAAQRQSLLTVAVVGAGPSGVETAATLADLLPSWYAQLGGNIKEIKIVVVNHGEEILSGDVNAHLQQTAADALKQRTVPVELLLGVGVKSVDAEGLMYQPKKEAKEEPKEEPEEAAAEQVKEQATQPPNFERLSTPTTIWTAGTATHPLMTTLPLPESDKDKHQRPLVTPTLQLLHFREVFAAGDCAVVQDHPQPPVAQIAYQQGAGIARNLLAMQTGEPLQPVQANMRGTLMKLGIHNGVANLFDRVQVKGEAGDLIRNATYLEMLPTPLHNFKATAEWLADDIFERHRVPLADSRVALGETEEEGRSHSPAVSKTFIGVLVGLVAIALAISLGLMLKPHLPAPLNQQQQERQQRPNR